jgi:TonB family protein
MSTSAVNQSQIPPGRGPYVPGPGPRRHDILPTLFGGPATYPVQANNFVLSFLLHVLGMMLILISGTFFVKKQDVIRQHVASIITDISPYLLPPAKDQAGGGGGGGDRDKLAASKGSLPKFAREQFTPPMAVVRNQDPKLAIEPTVVVPPEINIPRNQGQLGDPMQGVTGPPSSGTGYGGGIGRGSGGGVGSGRGPGVGPGWGGGIGGGPYRVGGGVSAPRPIFQPDPEYSDEARKAKYQGTVVLWVVVGPDGRTHEIRVQRSLGMGLDEKAVEAVKTWKFEPARKDGTPVAVQVNIEVNFRLY